MSIITVCYNAVAVIEDTIQSVICQTYSNIEYIIVDGGSTDGTMAIVKKYSNRVSKIVSEPDHGVYDAMNKGIVLATGDYINFMNAGDKFFNNNIIDRVAREIVGKPVVVYGDVASMIGGIMYAQRSLSPLFPMGFNHQSSFVSSSYAKENLFNLKYKYAADYDMMFTAYKRKCVFLQLGMIISQYDTDGMSEKNRRQHKFETLMIEKPDNFICNIIRLESFMIIWRIKKIIKHFCLLLFPPIYKSLKLRNNRFYIVNS